MFYVQTQAFSHPYGLKSVFEKLSFREDGRPNRRNKPQLTTDGAIVHTYEKRETDYMI